jgi:gamma-glutamyl hercynylcysteine S-oxide synthase
MPPSEDPQPALDILAAWVQDARRRTLEQIADLDNEQLLGPRLEILNPLQWEIGHVAWFQERWVLRHAYGRPPLRPYADALYDSAAVAHSVRWDLPLPSRQETLRYMAEVEKQVLEQVALRPRPDAAYFTLLSVFHEDMHTEAFTYTRQTLGYPAPRQLRCQQGRPAGDEAPWSGDAVVPGGTFNLGAAPGEPFAFDNEKWAHPVSLRPFAIARSPVTQAEFAAFVEDGAYLRREMWSGAGWAWRERAGATGPLYWRREAGGWMRRDFDRWLALEPHRPAVHVNWYEADAYCRWAGRRLPLEAEWEAAASLADGGEPKRRFPWGESAPTPERANLDGASLGCAAVAAYAAGDSAPGCRQMIGNVWEWTADDFLPYPGFSPDPYKEYSAPWFGDHKVLRGGCWATRGRLLRNTWRNFYRPDRRDVFAGFRTCLPWS